MLKQPCGLVAKVRRLEGVKMFIAPKCGVPNAFKRGALSYGGGKHLQHLLQGGRVFTFSRTEYGRP